MVQSNLRPKEYSPTFAAFNLSGKITDRLAIDGQMIPIMEDGADIQGSTVDSLTRTVRFSQSVDSFVISYSAVAPSILWYSSTEYFSFRLDMKRLTERLDNGFEEETSGLERWTKRGKYKFHRNHMSTIKAVVGEKDLIIKHTPENEEAIAHLYRDVALYAKVVANSKGMRAERVAKDFLTSSSKKPLLSRSDSGSARQVSKKRRSSFTSCASNESQCKRTSKYVAAREEIRHALLNVRRLGFLGLP
jgi:hypothetical protein